LLSPHHAADFFSQTLAKNHDSPAPTWPGRLAARVPNGPAAIPTTWPAYLPSAKANGVGREGGSSPDMRERERGEVIGTLDWGGGARLPRRL
jgi:hypothetical protein